MRETDGVLVSAEKARELDAEAASDWGLHPFGLVEAAGRSCAESLVRSFPELFSRAPAGIAVFAGPGNNGADALVMLRFLILNGYADSGKSFALLSKDSGADEISPRSEALKFLKKVRFPLYFWPEDDAALQGKLGETEILIDGISGTGIKNALEGAALEMVELANRTRGPLKVSVDIPSGLSDSCSASWPRLNADYTLAIEPQKLMLYIPSCRVSAGTIIPVGGIFPERLLSAYGASQLYSWAGIKRSVSALPRDSYKYSRGVVSVYAGSGGMSGAAVIAARGAQAAGAGLVRLFVDRDIYPIAAFHSGGIMVVPREDAGADSRFPPDSILLGPGWGRGKERIPVLEAAIAGEAEGLPVILDADALYLSGKYTFHGNALITPHPGELAAFAEVPKEQILENPIPVLRTLSREKNVHILFKSHVLIAAAPDGRLSVVDGMLPALGSGGSGDLLAGLCAAIAARLKKGTPGNSDLHYGAVLAACLFIEAGRRTAARRGFPDPLDVADTAAQLAGDAWLGTDTEGNSHG